MTHRLSSNEIAQSARALFADLETSLADSQQALLARDFTRFEQCTREQIGLHRALEVMWPLSSCDLASCTALREAQLRVLRAVRVQAALLDRAQRWIRTLANLIAGPEANYCPHTNNTKGPHAAASLPGPHLAWPSGDRCICTGNGSPDEMERKQCPA